VAVEFQRERVHDLVAFGVFGAGVFWRWGVSGCIGCIVWLVICMCLDTSFAAAYIGWMVVINGALSQTSCLHCCVRIQQK
jgi:hypothetical protein